MNIGIDGKWFFTGNPSGRVVMQNLVREFLQQDTENQYYIFLQKKDKDKVFPYTCKNIHLIYIWSPTNLLSNVVVTPYYARKYKIDVFFYQYFGPFLRYSKVVTLIHDVIFESHPEYFSLKERAYFKPMRFLARKADRIVTVSANEKARIVKYQYALPGKVSVIHLGAAGKFFSASEKTNDEYKGLREKYNLPEKYVLYVGRLNYRKNIHNLITAFQFVKEPGVKLVLAGGYDWKMFDVTKYIADKGLEEKVMLLGYVEEDYLPAVYALSQLFCFVSFEEGFGLPPLEAMAAGVPVLVANKGSLPEVCGSAALYVEPDNPEAIGQTINSFFSDLNLSTEMKRKSREQAAGFSWEKTASEYLKLFYEVVQESK